MAAPDGRQHFAATSIVEWKRSDTYHNSFLIPKDEVLEGILKNNANNRLPDIAVSMAQGKFLNLLVRTLGAKRVLEVGTLGGVRKPEFQSEAAAGLTHPRRFSTVWFARGLPVDGKIITLELSTKCAKVRKHSRNLHQLTKNFV